MKNKLKEIRMKEHLMNTGEFAKMLGIGTSTYCNWESGLSCPNLPRAIEVAKKLNKHVEEIWYSE